MNVIALALLIVALVLFVLGAITNNTSKLVASGLAAWVLSIIIGRL